MAGRPRRAAMIAELLRLTADEFDDQPDASPLDYVEFRLASGDTMKDIADGIATATKPADLSPEHAAVGWCISGEMVRRYLDEQHGSDAVDARLSRARARGSYSVVDEAKAIADTTLPEAGEVAKARLRVSTRHWMAERHNATAFGSKQGVSVNVSIGSLHLDALRQSPARAASIVTGAVIATVHNTDGSIGSLAQPVAIAAVSE